MSQPPQSADSQPEYQQQHDKAMRNGEHWYIDAKTGFMVFTQRYHLERGFCCQSACRHCPYGFEK